MLNVTAYPIRRRMILLSGVVPVRKRRYDLGSAPKRNIEFVFPQGLKQVVPEMKSDLYRPKRFFGVRSPVPLHVEGHRVHQVWLGVA